MKSWISLTAKGTADKIKNGKQRCRRLDLDESKFCSSGEAFYKALLEEAAPYIIHLWPRGQAVKTSPFHGGNTSSNLVGVIFVAR